MLYFLIVYLFLIYGIFSAYELIFFNEETLIAFCMIIVFYFLVKSLRKMINFSFFYRAESIYFSFLHLINLNLALMTKMLNLVTLKNSTFELVFIYQSTTFINDFIKEISVINTNLNITFLNNFIAHTIAILYYINNFITSYYTNINFIVNKNAVSINLTDSTVAKLTIQTETISPIVAELTNTDLFDFYNENNSDLDLAISLVDIDFLAEL